MIPVVYSVNFADHRSSPTSMIFSVCGVGSLRSGAYVTSFGTNGSAVYGAFPTYALNSAATQADGKVIASGSDGLGNSVLLRFNLDGSQDLSFGASGVVTVAGKSLGALTIQPDGKLVGYGLSGSPAQVTITRLSTAGVIDPTFNGSGSLILSDSNYSFNVNASPTIRTRSDGGLFVLFSGQNQTTYHVAAVVAKIKADGTLDTLFGGAGTGLYIGVPDGALDVNFGNGVIRPDGKLLAAAGSYGGGSPSELILFNDTGLDNSFHGAGYLSLSPAGLGPASLLSAICDTQGNFAFGGQSLGGLLTAFLTDGNGDLNLSFNGNGVATFFPYGSATAQPSSLFTANGSITFANATSNSAPGENSGILYRFDSTGRLDETFGDRLDGVITQNSGYSIILLNQILSGPAGSGTFYWITWGLKNGGGRQLIISKLWQ